MTQNEHQSDDELDLLNQCPGAVGDLARAINASLPADAPMIALANAFLAAGVIRSGRLQCGGVNANSYHAIIAPSGTGKTIAQKRVECALYETGFGNHLMGDFTSEAALLQELKQNTTQVLMLDEFGRVLSEMAKPTGYKHEAMTCLLKIYSDSDSFYRGKAYAPDSRGGLREKITIYKPQVFVLGSSTPSAFFEGMTLKAAFDGFLGRCFLWFEEICPEESRRIIPFKIPKSFEREAKRFLDWEKMEGDLQLDFKAFEIEHEDPEIFEAQLSIIRDSFRKVPVDLELKRTMLVRAAEFYSKLCICFTKPDKSLGFAESDYARRLLVCLYDKAWSECRDRIGMSQKDEEFFNKRQKLLSKIPIGGITHWQLIQDSRRGLQPRERLDILKDLIEAGEIRAQEYDHDEHANKPGPKPKRYFRVA